MGFFGGGSDLQLDHQRLRARQQIKAEKNQYRKAGSNPTDVGDEKYSEAEMKEARRRFGRENPSRFHWLFRLGEILSKPF